MNYIILLIGGGLLYYVGYLNGKQYLNRSIHNNHVEEQLAVNKRIADAMEASLKIEEDKLKK